MISISSVAVAEDDDSRADDVALLIKTLDHPDPEFQLLAVKALRRYAEDADEAVGPLIRRFAAHE